MQVVAIRMGFWNGTRRRVGEVFDMPEPLPSWVKPTNDPAKAKAEAEAAKKAEHEKQRAGAIAASGGKAAKAKVDAIAEQLAG